MRNKKRLLAYLDNIDIDFKDHAVSFDFSWLEKEAERIGLLVNEEKTITRNKF